MDVRLLSRLLLSTVVARASAQFPFPAGVPLPLPLPAPAPVPPPATHFYSLPVAAPPQVRPQQMPVVVMPYRSRAADQIFEKKKRRRLKFYKGEFSSESLSRGDDVCSGSEFYFGGSKGRRLRKKKREVLTPVISYMTRNGRVVYQKKIKKDDPGEWLQLGDGGDGSDGGGLTVRDLRRKYGLRRRRRGRGH